ncbi:hypothetical protein Efla_003680 [Eimeria flavescens]
MPISPHAGRRQTAAETAAATAAAKKNELLLQRPPASRQPREHLVGDARVWFGGPQKQRQQHVQQQLTAANAAATHHAKQSKLNLQQRGRAGGGSKKGRKGEERQRLIAAPSRSKGPRRPRTRGVCEADEKSRYEGAAGAECERPASTVMCQQLQQPKKQRKEADEMLKMHAGRRREKRDNGALTCLSQSDFALISVFPSSAAMRSASLRS